VWITRNDVTQRKLNVLYTYKHSALEKNILGFSPFGVTSFMDEPSPE
jgi:hypothetical protein